MPMVAAATAILKDIDLSNTSKNTSKPASSGGEIRVLAGLHRPAHQILTASVKRALCAHGLGRLFEVEERKCWKQSK